MTLDPDHKRGWTTPQSYLPGRCESYRVKRRRDVSRLGIAVAGLTGVAVFILLIIIERL